MKIKSINITAFRGIPEELNLDLQEKSLLLLGENGTGKSSIIDAIEFFFTGKISHLKTRGDLALDDYGPNTNNPEKSSVSLEINPETHIITRTFNSTPDFPDIFKEDIDLAKNGKFILRRSQILNLINTTPSERYKFISDIIGSEKLEKIDTAMFQANKYLKEKIKDIEEKIDKNNSEINEILNIQNSDEILFHINQLLTEQSLESLNSIGEIEGCVEEIDKISKQIDNKSLNALNDSLRVFKNIFILIEKILEELSKSEKYVESVKNNSQSEFSLMKLLQNSLEIIEKNAEKCPLCENDIDGEKLIYNIKERLARLDSIKQTNENLKYSLNNVNNYSSSIYNYLIELESKVDYFDELKEFKEEISSYVKILCDILKNVNVSSVMTAKFSIDEFKDFILKLDANMKDICAVSKQLEESIEPSKEALQLQNLNQNLKDVSEILQKQNKNLDLIKGLKHQSEVSEIIYTEFSSIKKRKIQEFYDTIKENVEHYYSILHPNESYENIKLGINPNRKGSTDLKMTIFGAKDKDPRSMSSEGHLDSLGLCIFLALFKKVYTNFSLLVLDDVVTTMDSRHREKVSQLLFEEFEDKQFIITTHDNIWFEQIKAAQRVYNLNNQFRNFTIIGWDEENGPNIRPYKVKWKKIEDRIKNGDKYCAGNEGRRYLEWLLEDICNRTQTKIPANPSKKYEINDLLEPAKSRLLSIIRDEDYKEKIDDAFRELDKNIMLGNLLSHHNPIANNVSIDEVNRFCNSVHEIDELLKCSKCHAPLGYFKDLKILRCKNKKCKDPLEIKVH